MLKRIICVLVSLSVLWSMVCMNVFSASMEVDDTRLSALKGLGVISGYETEDKMLDKMSKSTFISFLLNLIYDEKFQAGYDEEALKTAEALNIINSADSVSADDVLRGNEAVKMSMCLLGYGDLCERTGGYPFGFLTMADRIGVTKGITIKDEMTNADAYKLLYNTMTAGIMDIEAVSVHGDEYKNHYSQYEDVTILNIYRKIFEVEGVVDANKTTGLYEIEGTTDDSVKIDGMEIRDPENLLFDSVGLRVNAFVKKEDSGLYTLIYAEPDEKNNVVVFETDNVKNVSSDISSIEYYPDDDAVKTKTAKIKASVSLLYNGTAYGDYTAADFKVQDGTVTLIDNNNDRIVDVIKIDAYKVMLVSSVSASGRVINNEFTKLPDGLTKLEFDDYNNPGDCVRFFKDGAEAVFEDIMPGDVLSVYESKGAGDKYVEVHISRQSEVVNITKVNTSTNEVAAGDVIYELSDSYYAAKNVGEAFAQEISAGRKYRIYLDKMGRIVGAKIHSDGGLSYGYLKTSGEISEAFEADYGIRVFGDDGKWKSLYLADKVKVGDNEGMTLLTAKQAEQKVKLYYDDIIGYELDKEGKINHIELPIEIETDLFDKTSVQDSDNRFIKTGERSRTYYYNNTSFESYHYMTADTKVIFVPISEPENENLYDVGNNYSFTRTTVNYVGYGCDEFGFLDLVLVKRDSTQSKKVGNQLYFVRSVGASLDSEGSVSPEITIASSVYYGLSLAVEDAVLLENVKQGDIIQFHVNAAGYIDNINHILNIDPDPTSDGEEILIKEITGDINSGAGQVKGVLKKADFTNERVLIESSRILALKVAKSVPVLIYDAKTNEVTSATVNDLNIDDYVVVQISDAKVTGLYVVRDVK